MRKSSLRKMKAAWANGAKSPGPSTPEAKYKISRNATKHGLTARSVLLPGEDQDAFRDFTNSFLAIYQPETDDEFLLVEEMIACKWKLRRAWGFESTIIRAQMLEDHSRINARFENAGPDVHAALAYKTLADTSGSLGQVHRQEVRLARAHDRALDRLIELQAARRESEEDDTPENPPPRPAANTNKPNLVTIEKSILQNNPKAAGNHPSAGVRINKN
jgi:hypothetical protein